MPGAYHEELYNLTVDPDELRNVVDDPAEAAQLKLARDRLMFVLDSYPPAQKTWTDSRLGETKH